LDLVRQNAFGHEGFGAELVTKGVIFLITFRMTIPKCTKGKLYLKKRTLRVWKKKKFLIAFQ